MKKIIVSIFILVIALQVSAQNFVTKDLLNPKNKKVYVASHRCDWRNYPENSIFALRSSIEMGVDIAEIDLKMTKDNVLVLMHDRTIDRTTTGKGQPNEYTLKEIQKFKLRNGLGRATDHIIPTFREFLDIAKGKIFINIDKGYDYLPQVIKELRETGTLSQTIININDNTTLDEIESKYGKISEDVTLMPVLAFKDKDKAIETLNSYLRHRNTIFQPVWSDDNHIEGVDFLELRKKGYGVWINSLWASLCGGRHDDRAVEQNEPDESWGWLIKKGANILQTDRPVQQLKYLKKKKLHNQRFCK